MLSEEKKRRSVLSSTLLQAVTQAFSHSAATPSPSDQLAKLSVVTPTTTETSSDIPTLATVEFAPDARARPSSPEKSNEGRAPLTPLLTLAREFRAPTPTLKRSSNFLKGCKWSPDGLCLLTNSDDNQLRLFEISCEKLPINDDLNATLHLQEPELIYDFEWYPHMDSSQIDTCFIVSTCRDNPVHLFDAYTGQMRASYKAFNHVEEVVAAYSLAFEPHSCTLYCGYERSIRAFNIERPGLCIQKWDTSDRTSKVSQSGIISCLTFNSQISGMYAAGSYAKSIGVYGDAKGELIAVLHGHVGGVTHLRFSPDGNQLYSGARKDGTILCWDMRNLGELLCTYQRIVNTNQRIYFDFDPSFTMLVTGNSNGQVLGWNLNNVSSSPSPTLDFSAHADCTNGISIHPKLPFLATSSGQRRFAGEVQLTTSEDEDEDNVYAELNLKKIPKENSVKIWSFVK